MTDINNNNDDDDDDKIVESLAWFQSSTRFSIVALGTTVSSLSSCASMGGECANMVGSFRVGDSFSGFSPCFCTLCVGEKRHSQDSAHGNVWTLSPHLRNSFPRESSRIPAASVPSPAWGVTLAAVRVLPNTPAFGLSGGNS